MKEDEEAIYYKDGRYIEAVIFFGIKKGACLKRQEDAKYKWWEIKKKYTENKRFKEEIYICDRALEAFVVRDATLDVFLSCLCGSQCYA